LNANGVFSAGVGGPLLIYCAGPLLFGIVMYDCSDCCPKPVPVGENGVPIDIAEFMDWACDWLVSTLGVMVSPLGTFLWKDDDLRFLFGPELPALVGEAGRERLVGVMVPDVV
jgi:hypothetical protein